MYNILKNHIQNATFDLPAVLDRIKSLHGRLDIDDAQRDELEALAREKATPAGSIDMAKKLLELEARVRALEDSKQQGGETEETAPDYQVGKWYYTGDKVTFDGKTYTCTAPEGVACVWSPADYPAYWSAVE